MLFHRSFDILLSVFRLGGDKLIKTLRERRGWSQSELARKAGIRQGVLSDIESGKTKHPRIDTIAAIAQALGVPMEKLMKKAG